MPDGGPTVLMIGLGGFGALWCDAISARGLRVVAGVDPEPRARAEFEHSFAAHRPAVFADLDRFSGEVDFVIDSAPPGDRPARILKVIDHAKCIVVAKPAVASLSDLDRLMAALGHRTKKVRVAMQKRHLPAFERLRDMVVQGVLGDVTYLRTLVELDGTFWKPGEVWRTAMAHPNLWEGAIHQLDLVLEWLPSFEVEQVSAFGWTPAGSSFSGVSDFNAMLRGQDGSVAHILARWSVTRPPITHYFEGVRLDGSRATAEVRAGRLEIDGVYHPVDNDGEAFMDIKKLNTRLAPWIFDLEGDAARLGLDRHREVLALAARIEAALET